jgi:hypothetical protein
MTYQERHRDRDPLLLLVDLFRGIYRDSAYRERSRGYLGFSLEFNNQKS